MNADDQISKENVERENCSENQRLQFSLGQFFVWFSLAIVLLIIYAICDSHPDWSALIVIPPLFVGLLVTVARLKKDRQSDPLPIGGGLVVAYCIWASAYILATSIGGSRNGAILNSTTSRVYIDVTRMMIPVVLFALPVVSLLSESFLLLTKVRSSHELSLVAAISWWVAVILCGSLLF